MTRIPGVEYLPGADVGQNSSRWQGVRCVILHEPQGGCDGIRNLGQTRHHSTPGTYNGSSCRDGRMATYYDDEVRCTHAAGANASGPGWENSDTTGVAYSDANLRRLGEQIMHYHRVHGVPLRYFANEGGGLGGRTWVDKSGISGFVAHRAVDYPPNRSYLHYDGPTAAEFERAIALAGGSATPTRSHPGMNLMKDRSNDRVYALWMHDAEWIGDPRRVDILKFLGVPYSENSQTEIATVAHGYGIRSDHPAFK